ncbi:MAG: type III pantothenate kinase [Magnetovibrionaceae bacterium]
MLLAIDSGNTNTVFALYDREGRCLGEWRAATNTNRTADEYGVWLRQLMEFENLSDVTLSTAIIASVVPATVFSLRYMCRKYFDLDATIVGDPELDLGIEVKLVHPEEVGADRLVNAVAGRETYGGPLIIIDFGTATTFDVIDDDGSYIGGAIAPGINLSLEALHMAAAKLPRVAIGRPTNVIGTDTVDAMKSGVFWGYVSLIEGLVKRIREEKGSDMTVIATGGLSSLFAGSTDVITKADPDLTLRGLWLIDHNNRPETLRT